MPSNATPGRYYLVTCPACGTRRIDPQNPCALCAWKNRFRTEEGFDAYPDGVAYGLFGYGREGGKHDAAFWAHLWRSYHVMSGTVDPWQG